MGTIDRFDGRAAISAALRFRPLATARLFFDWWGEHRAWPANESARIPEGAARGRGCQS